LRWKLRAGTAGISGLRAGASIRFAVAGRRAYHPAMAGDREPIRGRGSASRLPGRFARTAREAEPEALAEENAGPAPRTRLHREDARSIVSRNDSPDLAFRQSINPYRGCEHGCVYCYARPAHAYVDLSPGIDFETEIFFKPDAPALLRRELARPGYACQPIAIGANTDGWQPAERELRITRGVLEVLAEHRHPVAIITKSALIERDLDILAPMAAANLVRVMVSVTTLDDELKRRMEPRTAGPARRLETIRRLNAAGVPAGVLAAPMIPALNDHELEAILGAAAAAGARRAGYILLRLPHEVAPLFEEWLGQHYPLRRARVLQLLRDMRGGRANDPCFGSRMRGTGALAQLLEQRFARACRALGLNPGTGPPLETGLFRVPGAGASQPGLF
jgi:DNA repair photolyase